VRGPAHQSLTVRLKRVVLIALMGVVTLNIWTGAPLLGLWVGSRVAPSSGISMLAVGVIAVTIGAVAFALVRVLGMLQAAHDRLTGHEHTIRRHTPWLRSMSGDRPRELGGEAPPLTAGDYMVVSVVVLAVAAFEIWFFFFAGSPFDGRTGRG
jgi:hypothetical protein